MALSPMMKQYLEVKKETPDCILLFRLGDFYEMFFEDAIIASKVLDIVLTGRDCGEEERAPMCGIPYHAAESYMHKLIKAGYRVAVAEQMEDPKNTKGIVRREVMRVISPGTVTDSEFLLGDKNNYLLSAVYKNGHIGAAFADVSTGTVDACCFTDGDAEGFFISQATAMRPSEALVFGSEHLAKLINTRFGARISQTNPEFFSKENAYGAVNYVTGQTVDEEYSLAGIAAGALLLHLRQSQKFNLSFIKEINFFSPKSFLQLDAFSRKNLEITASATDGGKRGSLLWVLDKTKTAMGARLLRKRLETPLIDVFVINTRLNSVAELLKDRSGRDDLRGMLTRVSDLERLCSKVAYGSANPKDLKALQVSMDQFGPIKNAVSGYKSIELEKIYREINTLDALRETLESYITDEPPVTYKEGGVIKSGVNDQIDKLRDLVENNKSWIAGMERDYREKTGIKALKIGYNRIFGYYIEVPKAFAEEVPEEFIRRQTLADKERFVTKELKDTESQVINAKDLLFQLETEAFVGLVSYVKTFLDEIRLTASALAKADVYACLAEVAQEKGYVRPEVDVSDVIDIKGGRHPVVEAICTDSLFVPNDCLLNKTSSKLHIITGPNMAGKSTYMRQVADIVLMAQMGSFVPAESARIGMVDKIFTRVGAGDDLASGISTFMLEMTEVAEILNKATDKSLIIYDEIGRGTSTYDGMSIARAVVEYTAEKIGARTLFATHYHELTDLEGQISGVLNYNIAAKKRGDEVIFLRRIVKGHASESYGIEVASLAGVPKSVVNRAKAVLKEITKNAVLIPSQIPDDTEEEQEELTLSDMSWENMKAKIKNTDINTITPIEAMGILYEIKKMVD